MLTHCRRKTTAAIVAAALFAFTAAPAGVAAAPPDRTPTASLPVVGTVLTGGTFSGTLALTSFAVRNGQVVALGTVTGVITDSAGKATTVAQNVSAPVAVAQATCSILHLDLGPLALNVLGLHVDLSEVVLDITGETGAGNLLGNLLCAVAGLLDNPNGLARLLNQILGALFG
jgi:hypothetical protein